MNIRGAKVHELGLVGLVDSMGTDIDIVRSARVSFARHDEDLDDSDTGLVGYLLRNRHGSPFEHVAFKFYVKAPIFVFREWHRHRIASINEMSGRYTELNNEFYIPPVDYVRTQVGKPGAYTFEQMSSDDAATVRGTLVKQQWEAWEYYQLLLKKGVAKEIARLVLPVSIYSQMIWSVNLRSLMNFLSLRNSEHAQREIRDYAIAIEDLIEPIVPVAMAAFRENGRIAP